MEISKAPAAPTPILLDLVDIDENDALIRALKAVGLSGEAMAADRDPAEAIRLSGAEFILAEGSAWASFSAALPRPPRSYLVVLLLDPADQVDAAAALLAGAFDYVLRDGPGWEGRVAIYFRALGALRRRLVAAIGHLESRYENLVHALPDIVYELDPEGHITFINNSIRLLGYEPSELIGKHFSVLLHEEDAQAVDRESILRYFEGAHTGPALSPKLFNERRGLDRRTENLELRLRKKRLGANLGSEEDMIASILSYGEVSAVGEYASGGSEASESDGEELFVGSVGIIRDITLRRKSEDMLRKLYQSVDQLSAGILLADRRGVVEYVNPSFLRISGRGPQDIIGSGLFSLFEFGPERSEELRSLVEGGFEVREEVRLNTPAGPGVWVAFHASPVRSPSGDVTHASIICEDISQARAMEELLRLAKEEAERANRAKSDFLASMSHELRSPVASILAAARLIEMGSPEPERRARSIIGSAQGLLSLLGDILDFVRFDTGSSSLRKFVFPLQGFVARTLEPYRLEAQAKGVDFQVGTVPEESILSDPDRLGRALGALLDNAVSYTDAGRISLEVGIEKRGGNVPHILFTVSDTGPGIAAEDQGRIFAPFVQLQSPFNKTGGAGIGLSLSRSIVRALGGEVRITSELGKGSVFTILVPSGEPSEIVESGEDEAKDKAVYRLLVVDDNEVNLEYMAAILGAAGHVVDKAESGAEALRLAEDRPPDAAILDIQMPGMSGIELEKRIRSYSGDRFDPLLPLLALTAFDSQEVSASGASFSSIFSKPFDAKLLAASLDKAVDEAEASCFAPAAASDRASDKAMEVLPELFDHLVEEAEKGRIDAFRTVAQQLAGRLDLLGAGAASQAIRRLALSFSWEERSVIESRVSRYAAAWRRATAAARRGAGPQEGGGS
jgi:PAS domain S-box-containing protein